MARKIRPTQSPRTGAVRALFRGDDRYYFVRAAYSPGGAYGTPHQRGYQLVVMVQGYARLGIGNESVTLKAGDGVLVQPGWRLLYRFSDAEPSVHTGCQVDAALLPPAERRLLAEVRGPHPVPAAIHPLIGEGLAAPPVTGPHFHDAQLLLARSCLLHFAAQVTEFPGDISPVHPALRRSLQLLENEPFELKTAHELARRSGISVSRLRQLYREHQGESPSTRLWRIKTEHALRMIRSTGLTLGEIALQCGFANPFHLSRSVKKLTGRSPRSLRQIPRTGAAPPVCHNR